MKRSVAATAVSKPPVSFLGQYWMVFAGSGLAMALGMVGLTAVVKTLKAKESCETLADSSSASLISSPESAALPRPAIAPDRLLHDFSPAPIQAGTAVSDTFVPRLALKTAKNEPAPLLVEIPDGMDNFEFGLPEPKGFKDLMAHLDHKYNQVRLKAIVGLGRMGAAASDAAPAIARALLDPDKDIKEAAGKALARIGPGAVPVLIEELKNSVSRNHVRAAYSLALIGPEAADAVPVLTECLKHKDGEIRAMAAHALGEIGPPAWKASAPLTLLLGDPVKEVSKQARAALAGIGPGAIPALRGALKSPQGQIRRQGTDLLALQRNNAKEAVTDLLILLKDKQAAVRQSAALALAAIGRQATEASDALVECAADTDPKVRAAAAIALGEIRAQGQAISALTNLFRDPAADVRFQATAAIIKIGPSAINVLINTIPHENINMRISAIFALGEIGPEAKDAVALLIEQLKDRLPLIRSQSALALGKIGPRAADKAAEPLKERIKQEMDTSVRIGMRLALVQVLPGDKEAAQQLNQDVLSSVIGTNQELVKRTLLSVMRPKTQMEILRQKKIQGVLDFYTFRNSFRFGDGLDDWSHKILANLGPEAIPAMVDTLNRDNVLGGKAGFVVNGRQVADWGFIAPPPPPGPMNVFFK